MSVPATARFVWSIVAEGPNGGINSEGYPTLNNLPASTFGAPCQARVDLVGTAPSANYLYVQLMADGTACSNVQPVLVEANAWNPVSVQWDDVTIPAGTQALTVSVALANGDDWRTATDDGPCGLAIWR